MPFGDCYFRRHKYNKPGIHSTVGIPCCGLQFRMFPDLGLGNTYTRVSDKRCFSFLYLLCVARGLRLSRLKFEKVQRKINDGNWHSIQISINNVWVNFNFYNRPCAIYWQTILSIARVVFTLTHLLILSRGLPSGFYSRYTALYGSTLHSGHAFLADTKPTTQSVFFYKMLCDSTSSIRQTSLFSDSAKYAGGPSEEINLFWADSQHNKIMNLTELSSK